MSVRRRRSRGVTMSSGQGGARGPQSQPTLVCSLHNHSTRHSPVQHKRLAANGAPWQRAVAPRDLPEPPLEGALPPPGRDERAASPARGLHEQVAPAGRHLVPKPVHASDVRLPPLPAPLAAPALRRLLPRRGRLGRVQVLRGEPAVHRQVGRAVRVAGQQAAVREVLGEEVPRNHVLGPILHGAIWGEPLLGGPSSRVVRRELRSHIAQRRPKGGAPTADERRRVDAAALAARQELASAHSAPKRVGAGTDAVLAAVVAQHPRTAQPAAQPLAHLRGARVRPNDELRCVQGRARRRAQNVHVGQINRVRTIPARASKEPLEQNEPCVERRHQPQRPGQRGAQEFDAGTSMARPFRQALVGGQVVQHEERDVGVAQPGRALDEFVQQLEQHLRIHPRPVVAGADKRPEGALAVRRAAALGQQKGRDDERATRGGTTDARGSGAERLHPGGDAIRRQALVDHTTASSRAPSAWGWGWKHGTPRN
eukprot:scaffold125872_cov60-Phaeocystis_antarctica.AAC.3